MVKAGAAIVQQRDIFCSGNGGSFAGAMQDFRDRRDREIFSAGEIVAFPNHGRISRVNEFCRINFGPEAVIGEDTIVRGITASRDRGAVHLRGAEIGGVMVAEGNAFAREFPKRRRISFAQKIRPHSVPNDDDDVALLSNSAVFGKCDRRQAADQERKQSQRFHR